jgi:hypothetical protein
LSAHTHGGGEEFLQMKATDALDKGRQAFERRAWPTTT